MMPDMNLQETFHCYVKWFNPANGFGFVVPEDGGPDMLLHAQTLVQTGRNSIADDVRMVVKSTQVNGRWQVTAIEKILNGDTDSPPKLAQLATLTAAQLDSLPQEPARVKWYDIGKGIGFANTLGAADDVFLHVEVLRMSCRTSVDAGEAIIVKTVPGDRGRVAVEVSAWFQYQPPN